MHPVALPIWAWRQVLVVLCGLRTAEGVDSKTRAISLYSIAHSLNILSFISFKKILFVTLEFTNSGIVMVSISTYHPVACSDLKYDL